MSDGSVVLADFDTCTSQDIVRQDDFMLGDIAEGDSPDFLYGIDSINIFYIDLVAKEMRPLGRLNFSTGTDAYFNSLVRESDGTLLAVTMDSSGSLFRIDVESLSATFLGATGYASAGDLTFYGEELYLSAVGGDLIKVNIVDPSSSVRVGSMNEGGFLDIFGAVTVIQGDPCSGDVNYEMVATGGGAIRSVDVVTGSTSNLCPNLFDDRAIYGAAEVTVATLCEMSLDLFAEDTVCSGEEVLIESLVSPDVAVGEFTYEWFEAGKTELLGTDPKLLRSFDSTATVVCVVTDSERVEPFQTVSAEITITVEPTPYIQPFSDVVAFNSYELPLILGDALPDSLLYTTESMGAGTGFSPGAIIQYSDFNTYPIEFYVYSGNELGCSVQQSFSLTLISENDPAKLNEYLLDVPQYFTPNGDGYHDFWEIITRQGVEVEEVSIYDRFGKLLVRLDPLELQWDGTYRGMNMPSTDYWFQISYRFQELSLSHQGHFTLKR